jgi:hypothetical protein
MVTAQRLAFLKAMIPLTVPELMREKDVHRRLLRSEQ